MLFTDFERCSSYDLISSLISRETYTGSEYLLEQTFSVVHVYLLKILIGELLIKAPVTLDVN